MFTEIYLCKSSIKRLVIVLKLLSHTKMEVFIETATPFYCLFWFESLVWWVNEGLWVQLSVVMRPLPYAVSLGHNSLPPQPMATPLPLPRGPGGNWGAPRPLEWSASHIGLGSASSRQMELWKELNSCLPPLHPHFLPSPCKTRLAPGTQDCSFAVLC